MILVDISGASAVIRHQDILTSGMVGGKAVFQFGEDWNRFAKTVVFRCGTLTRDAVLVDSIAEIPHEVLVLPGIPLEIGVYGTADNGLEVIPTVWAKTDPVKRGTDPSGDVSLDPTLPFWAQMQEQLNNSKALPPVTEADNGKILQVSGGKWAAAELPVYDGAFEITPSVTDGQTLLTAQTFLDANIKISKVPYSEVSNNSGGMTANIGG